MSDKLYDAAKFYQDELINKQFRFVVSNRKGKLFQFDVVFGAKNFKHLVGIQHLEDLSDLQARKSSILFRQILNKEVSEDTIKKSLFYEKVKERVERFPDIKKALLGKDIIIAPVQRERFNDIKADYMLTDRSSQQYYAHLFLIKDDPYVMPISFIIQDDERYFRNNYPRLNVVSVEEVKKNEKISQPKTIAQQTQKEIITIEPMRVYQTYADKGVLIKKPGNKAGEKTPIKLPAGSFVLDKDGTHVIGVREDLQQKHGLKLPVGQPKRYLK